MFDVSLRIKYFRCTRSFSLDIRNFPACSLKVSFLLYFFTLSPRKQTLTAKNKTKKNQSEFTWQRNFENLAVSSEGSVSSRAGATFDVAATSLVYDQKQHDAGLFDVTAFSSLTNKNLEK